MILDTPPLIDGDDDALRIPSYRQISTSGESIMLRILECECYGRNPLRFSLKIIYEELGSPQNIRPTSRFTGYYCESDMSRGRSKSI